jgi:hypothetical protein
MDSHDIKEAKIMKYYRLVRKWACKTYNLTDSDLELLIYLDCKDRFTRNDFKEGAYTMGWDRKRWEKLRKAGWIDVWRQRNRITQKYTIYKTSFKCKSLIMRMYRIMAGQEDLPTSERSVFYKNKTYTDKVFNQATDLMVRDKDR